MINNIFKNLIFYSTLFSSENFFMDTVLRQKAYGFNALSAMGTVNDEIARLEKLWNRFDPESIISKINISASSERLKIDPDTKKIIQLSKEISEMVENAFDITSLPCTMLWRKAEAESILPDNEKIKYAISDCGSECIKLYSDDAVYFTKKNAAVDLGGIAKGYAADKARSIYIGSGIKNALFNFGGNVLALGSKPDGSPWKIGIQYPASSRGCCFGYLEETDSTVVTSGSYERYIKIKEKIYSHIIDLKTGEPADSGILSATVISDSSAYADALATAVIVLGKEKSRELFSWSKDLKIIIMENNNKISMIGKRKIIFTSL